MSKRFTDTEIWKQAWFRKLSPTLKEFWRYMCDNCNGAGVWEIDFDTASHFIGDRISDESLTSFGNRVIRVADDKLWLSGFITFQYKTLKAKNKAQRGMMRSVVDLVGDLPLEDDSLKLVQSFKCVLSEPNAKDERGSIDPQQTPNKPPTDPQLTPQVTETVKVTVMEKKKEGGVGEVSENQLAAESDWLGTLSHFGIERPVLPHERIKILQLLKNYDPKAVRYALTGMRFQAKTDTFNPANYVSLARVMEPKNFETFLNLTAAKVTDQKKKEQVTQAKTIMKAVGAL